MFKLLSSLAFALLFTSCASQESEILFAREVHPEFPTRIQEGSLVFWAPMDTLDYQLKKACSDYEKTVQKVENTGWVGLNGQQNGTSDCLATSPSGALFEYNNRLRDFLINSKFEAVESFPGVGPLEERDTLWNELLESLRQEPIWSFERWEEFGEEALVYNNVLNSNTRMILSRLNAEYGVDFLWTPLQTQSWVWAENSGEGAVELWHHLALWDAKNPALLLWVRYKHSGYLGENKNLSKQLWEEFFRRLELDFKGIQENWQLELDREER